MGNIVRNIAAIIYDQNESSFPGNDPPDPTRIRHPASMDPAPIISIPIDADMSDSVEKRIQFRVRHAATDFPATVIAHQDHKIATLKRCLIEHTEMPFPSKDGKCKILMIWNKPHLLRDELLKAYGENELEIDQRFIGGSIDHLKLGEYGLENGDILMFTVTFPQLLRVSSISIK
ncbi:unnamed protein product [Rotaria magnacalcarata]|uniref:Ubiquitin-like domain-containing protein n=1 Tax=Rotaria magnacalcarata TaxID=392030 RepID=A0A820GZX3_9BILA|nr:unnamed protein product [Rotaria magnacalcarata]CAF4285640.1 unnamed protein product [Rotaria magnacalcarata]